MCATEMIAQRVEYHLVNAEKNISSGSGGENGCAGGWAPESTKHDNRSEAAESDWRESQLVCTGLYISCSTGLMEFYSLGLTHFDI